MPRAEAWVTLTDCRIVRETAKAMLVEYDGEEIWLPVSQVRDAWQHQTGDTADVEISEWIAREKGLDLD